MSGDGTVRSGGYVYFMAPVPPTPSRKRSAPATASPDGCTLSVNSEFL